MLTFVSLLGCSHVRRVTLAPVLGTLIASGAIVSCEAPSDSNDTSDFPGFCEGSFAPEEEPGVEDALIEYWSERLAALPDPNATFTRAPERDTPMGCQAYDVAFDSHPSATHAVVRLHGRYWAPAAGGPHPAMLFMNGYGGTMALQWTGFESACDDAGVAVFLYDYRGSGVNLDMPETREQYPAFASSTFMVTHIAPGEEAFWSNTGIVMDAVQAGRFLRSRAEICGSGIVATGFSWGGYTGLLVPALDGFPKTIASGAPGPTAARVADLFLDAPTHPAVVQLRSYIEAQPEQHAHVCRMLYLANAYNHVPALSGTTVQGWVGTTDFGYQWARDTFARIFKWGVLGDHETQRSVGAQADGLARQVVACAAPATMV